MQLTVVGSGDAFGSGGRLQACYHLETAGARTLIDCGVTSLIGCHRLGIDPDAVDAIVVSHLHGDHFGGLVWWVMHARHIARRTRPLKVVGPAGIAERFLATTEALFPASGKQVNKFELTFDELTAGRITRLGDLDVLPFLVNHPSGAPAHAIRISAGGKVLGFSGDTEWVDALTDVAKGADLYITECSSYEKAIPFHLSWRTIEASLPRLAAKRVMITHMNADMLAKVSEAEAAGVIVASDGLKLAL